MGDRTEESLVAGFPSAAATQPIPTSQTTTQTITGFRSTIFTRPSAWLAGGTMLLLILEVILLAVHKIPAEQLDTFKSVEAGTMLLFGIMVRDVFNHDAGGAK